jgi:hypothetical protein
LKKIIKGNLYFQRGRVKEGNSVEKNRVWEFEKAEEIFSIMKRNCIFWLRHTFMHESYKVMSLESGSSRDWSNVKRLFEFLDAQRKKQKKNLNINK